MKNLQSQWDRWVLFCLHSLIHMPRTNILSVRGIEPFLRGRVLLTPSGTTLLEPALLCVWAAPSQRSVWRCNCSFTDFSFWCFIFLWLKWIQFFWFPNGDFFVVPLWFLSLYSIKDELVFYVIIGLKCRGWPDICTHVVSFHVTLLWPYYYAQIQSCP